MAMLGARELSVGASATAAWTAGAVPCLLALAEDGAGALTVEGRGALRVGCAVEVRSSDANAILLTDGGCLSADRIAARAVQDACLAPAPTEPRAVRAASIERPGPSCAGLPAGAVTTSSEGVFDYWPGCYAERLRIADGASFFAAGEYVLLDGLEILGGEAAGADVAFLGADGPVEIRGPGCGCRERGCLTPSTPAARPGSPRPKARR